MAYAYYILSTIALLTVYLWHVNRGIRDGPPEALELAQKPWTPDEVRQAYEKTKASPTDVSKHLPPKQGRRYLVVGGSGLVGGWITQHLLLRGEDPNAIRILDLRAPTQSLILESTVHFIKTDVSSAESVEAAFSTSWPNAHLSNLPLTVFHTVAYINPSERTADSMSIYQAVNIDGTKHVLEASQKAGATCLVATASGSIGVRPPAFFLSPFSRRPRNIFQVLSKPENLTPASTLSDYGSCYAYSKAIAESDVLSANSTALQTGCIRPGHAIYGAGVSNVSSISWSYLSRGGSPSWLQDTVTNFVNAQNVSIAHLAYEGALLDGKDVAGRTYYVTDPTPPLFYGCLYTLLSTLSHASTPCTFPRIPPLPMLLLSYPIECYLLLRQRYPLFRWLPPLTGDLALLTPAMFNMSTVHTVYDNRDAQREIGYDPPISTLEGLCLQMVEWNAKVEKGIIEKGGLTPREGSASKIVSEVVSGGQSTIVPGVMVTNETEGLRPDWESAVKREPER